MSSIKKNFLYSSILTSANYIFPLIVYPYVSRVLGVTGIGACNFVDSIIKYFVIISMFGITSIGIREIAKAKASNKNLSEVFNNLFWTNALFTLIAVVVLLFVIFAVPSLIPYRKLLFIGVVKVISNFFLMDWLFRGLEDFKYITIRTLIVKCLYVISIFIFIQEENDYEVYYLLTVLMITVNSLFNQTYARRFVKIRFNGVKVVTYLASIIIMGVYSVMTSMYTTFNTAYLGFVAGDEEVGYYTMAHSLYDASLAFFSAFTGVMLPRMSSLLSSGQFDKFKDLLGRSASILFSYSFPFVFLFIIYAPEIIGLYAGNGYEGAIVPMQISMPLMIVIGYEQIIITQGLLPLDKNKAVLINAIVGACSGVILSFIIVGTYKSIGSSIVWALSEILVLTSASVFIKKYIDFHFPFKHLTREGLLYIPLLVFLLYLHKIELNAFISLILAGVVVLIYTFIAQRFVMKQQELVALTNKIFPRKKQ